MYRFKSIAIDGPSGAGKSTIAKALAKKINYIYVDTGALYRVIGFFMLNNKIPTADETLVIKNLNNIDIKLAYLNGLQHVFLNNIDVFDKIRTPQVSIAASNVSAFKKVREFLLELQRNIARKNNVIMDGRDIATVVLPEADIKIFLTASLKIRASRRYNELIANNNDVTIDQVYCDMVKRDNADSNRSIAPLKKSKDAILIDSTDMSFDETLNYIYSIIKEKL